MNQHIRIILLSALTAGIAFSATLAFADKGRGNSEKAVHKSYEREYGDRSDYLRHDDGKVDIRIDFGDRDIIRDYLRADYRRDCPPGLAKKHNGCLPPGQAKKYRIGHRLPDDVVFYPLSEDLLERLSRPPRGYQYVRVDKDILLIGEATKKVIDAVTLLSAVGN